MSNKQSRKWQLTINNPVENGFPHSVIKSLVQEFEGLIYMCLCDERGAEGTYHTHVYFQLSTPRYFSTIKNKFPSIVHIENCRGKAIDNRNYVLKDGEKYNKLADGSYNYIDKDGNIHTGINYTDTFEEYGQCPDEQQGKKREVDKILDMIKAGSSNQDIVDECPIAMLNIDKVDRTRSMYRDERFKHEWRNLEVVYIWGDSGSGKTRSIMDKYGYAACYRVTDYKHPFDNYEGQDVVIFEEFRSQFDLSAMLNYLDGYPLLLPCRYFNRQACYTKVFIISNIPFYEQYVDKRGENKIAWTRRVNKIVHMKRDNTIYENEFVQGGLDL